MDILVARDLLSKLTKAERDLLTQAERGIALTEVDQKAFTSMIDKSLVRTGLFENTKASDAIVGVILTEDGRKVIQARTVYEEDKITAEVQKADADADAKTIEVMEDTAEVRQHVAEDKASELVDTNKPPKPEKPNPNRKPPIR